jgi:trimeric autotransporter adhesin
MSQAGCLGLWWNYSKTRNAFRLYRQQLARRRILWRPSALPIGLTGWRGCRASRSLLGTNSRVGEKKKARLPKQTGLFTSRLRLAMSAATVGATAATMESAATTAAMESATAATMESTATATAAAEASAATKTTRGTSTPKASSRVTATKATGCAAAAKATRGMSAAIPAGYATATTEASVSAAKGASRAVAIIAPVAAHRG